MTETAPAPQPVLTPAPTPHPGQTPSGINQALAVSLTRVENITKAALKPDRLALLSADGSDIAQPFLDAILAEVTAVRKLLGVAGQQTTEKENATEEGTTLEEQLIRAIQAMQARARQKYGANSHALANFHIGTRLGDNRALLEQVSQNILTALETDPLPGVTDEKIAALKDVRKEYVDSELDQTGSGGDASTSRKSAKTRLDALVEKRQKIQFAADAIWPWHADANVGLRKEFDLPATRPYSA